MGRGGGGEGGSGKGLCTSSSAQSTSIFFSLRSSVTLMVSLVTINLLQKLLAGLQAMKQRKKQKNVPIRA